MEAPFSSPAAAESPAATAVDGGDSGEHCSSGYCTELYDESTPLGRFLGGGAVRVTNALGPIA